MSLTYGMDVITYHLWDFPVPMFIMYFTDIYLILNFSTQNLSSGSGGDAGVLNVKKSTPTFAAKARSFEGVSRQTCENGIRITRLVTSFLPYSARESEGNNLETVG